MAPAADREVRIGQTDDTDARARPVGITCRRAFPACLYAMETLLTSILTVAVAEIGDKTQLLAIVLAAKFRKPVPIILGILAATILNHAAAASLGYFISQW